MAWNGLNKIMTTYLIPDALIEYFSQKESWVQILSYPSGYLLVQSIDGNLFKVNNSQWCRSGALIVNFERISHIILVYPLLTLSQ